MPQDIAVICASPPGLNPGMESVDRALLYLAQKQGFRDRLRFYRLYAPPSTMAADAAADLAYSIIPPDEDFFRSQSAVIYWGDFLHMRQYHETVANVLVKRGMASDAANARSRVQQVFLQAGEDAETLRRTLTFGSTLLFNTAADESDPSYHGALARFLTACRGAWFRDVFSAFKACLIRGSFEPGCLGVDCANLIDPERTYPSAARPPVAEKVGIFLGRTAGNVAAMLGFASRLAKALHCSLSWLNWGDATAFPQLPSILKVRGIRALGPSLERPAYRSSDAMEQLLGFRAIVTDTYHICVNAWNVGVPAICVLGDEYAGNRSVNFGDNLARRDKRVVFMSMYDALDFVVPADELQHPDRRDARIRHLVDLVHSGKQIAGIAARIRAHADAAEQSFMHALTPLL